ncbi:MAG: HD domain-containing protein [Clostridia bacterium]|nr:HD domain-containing protein [Clostridia bacterium]
MPKISVKARLVILLSLAVMIPFSIVAFNLFFITKLSGKSRESSIVLDEYIQLLKIELFILLALIVCMAIFYVFFRKNFLIPFQKIKEGVHAIRNGFFSYRLNLAGSDEISEIACTFNDMADNLEQSIEKIKVQASELYSRKFKLQKVSMELDATYEQLDETEKKFHSLINNIPDVILVIDDEGNITFVNDACTDMFGYDKLYLTGKNIMDLVDTKKMTMPVQRIAQKLLSQKSVSIRLSLAKKDGSVIITEAIFTNYIFNGVNMGLQATVRDITRKRRMEEEIIQSNNDLAIINSVSRSLTSTLDLNELFNLITNEVSGRLKYPLCLLGLADKDGLNVKAFSGVHFQDSDCPLNFESSTLKKDILEKVIGKSEILRIKELSKDSVIDEINRTKLEGGKVVELLSVPINCANKKMGVLIVGSSYYFKRREVNLISSIANNAAVAIENALLYESTRKYFIKTIDVLIAAIEAKDKYTEGHSQRVSKYAVKIAKKMGLAKEQIEDIKVAGILHDIGKIGISDSILLKADKLTKDEYEEIKQHPAISNKILHSVGFSDRTLKAIAYHHERYDGKGYPFGLIGEDITIEAQIIAVADAYDAMTSNRSYRKAMSREEALNELFVNKETQFNPKVIDALFHAIDYAKDFLI